jgi:hypothetical protein
MAGHSKIKDERPAGGVVFAFNSKWVSWLHTISAYGELFIPGLS